MKCTCCGNTELSRIRDERLLPFYVCNGDGILRLSDSCDVYICTSCGHYEFFNNAYVSKFNETKKHNDSINEQIKQLESKRDNLRNKVFDPKPFEKEIEKLQNEINTLKSLSVSGRDLKIREDAIADNRKIIETRVDPNIKNEVDRLDFQINELRRQLKQI